MIPKEWLTEAEENLSNYIYQTPLYYDSDNDIYIKWENHQITGSFKIRGALNKLLSLNRWELKKGIVTASAGNHGLAVAFGANKVGCSASVYVPESAVKLKIDAIKSLGARVIPVPGEYGDAEKAGIQESIESGKIWISPYNDGKVIAGQATLAFEIVNQLKGINPPLWIVPVGGGGLISGIGAGLQELYDHQNRPQIVGVQSEASPSMFNIINFGNQDNVIVLPSLADGLAGRIQEDSITIPLIKKYLSKIRLVSEVKISRAIEYAWKNYSERIEGSGAVTFDLLEDQKIKSRPCVLIVTGGNINPSVHSDIIKAGNSLDRFDLE